MPNNNPKDIKEILEEKAREEAILYAIGDGLVVTDLEGNITLVNRAFEEMLGWKSEEVIGRDFVEIVPKQDEQGYTITREERFRPIRSRAASEKQTYYYVRKDKSRFPVGIVTGPIVLNGEQIGIVQTFRDITEQIETDRAKTEFLSIASHQLRTPLSSLNWYTEMLLEPDTGQLNEEQKIFVTELSTAARRMSILVNDLLDISRLQLGKLQEKAETVNISILIEEILQDQVANIHNKNLNIDKTNIQPITIQIDKKLIRMVIENVISNAVKYTPPNGIIRLDLYRKDGKIYIITTDSGYGIPIQEQEKIFSQFYRATNIKDKIPDSSGLGLYITKHVLEILNGQICFTSIPTQGTTFRILLEDKISNTLG